MEWGCDTWVRGKKLYEYVIFGVPCFLPRSNFHIFFNPTPPPSQLIAPEETELEFPGMITIPEISLGASDSGR